MPLEATGPRATAPAKSRLQTSSAPPTLCSKVGQNEARRAQREMPRVAPPVERRGRKRQLLWFPVRVDTDGEPSWVTVCRDASGSGMLLAAPAGSNFQVGMEVQLTFRTPQDDVTDSIRGRIVRRDANRVDEAFLWPHLLGIEFDEPHERLGRLTRRVASATHFE